MNSIILCEGRTDAILLSYYLGRGIWLVLFKETTQSIYQN